MCARHNSLTGLFLEQKMPHNQLKEKYLRDDEKLWLSVVNYWSAWHFPCSRAKLSASFAWTWDRAFGGRVVDPPLRGGLRKLMRIQLIPHVYESSWTSGGPNSLSLGPLRRPCELNHSIVIQSLSSSLINLSTGEPPRAFVCFFCDN